VSSLPFRTKALHARLYINKAPTLKVLQNESTVKGQANSTETTQPQATLAESKQVKR
jgi:hypothetical protein